MTELWLYSCVPVMVIVSLTVGARLLSQSWTHPATLFPLIWAAHTLMPIILAPDIPLYPSGLWWIAASCLAVQTGAFLTAPPSRMHSDAAAKARVRHDLQCAILPTLILTTLCLVPLALVAAYLTIDEMHRSLQNLTSVKGLAKMVSAASVFRYSTKYYKPSLVVQFFSSAVYFVPMLGGILYALRRDRRNTLVAFSTFLPALFVTATQGTKAAALLAIVYWIASYLACTEYTGGRPSGLRIAAVSLFGCVLLAALIGTAESLRGGKVPTLPGVLIDLQSNRTRGMVFGHMFVFTEWFDQSFQSPPEPTYGAYTFAGPVDLIGVSTRVAGVFSDSMNVLSTKSNVYTYFRPLIQDFTLPGSLAFLFGGGIIGGWAYRGALEHRIDRLPYLMLYNAATLWYFSSVFTYNTLVVSLVVLIAYWWMLTRSLRVKAQHFPRTAACRA